MTLLPPFLYSPWLDYCYISPVVHSYCTDASLTHFAHCLQVVKYDPVIMNQFELGIWIIHWRDVLQAVFESKQKYKKKPKVCIVNYERKPTIHSKILLSGTQSVIDSF